MQLEFRPVTGDLPPEFQRMTSAALRPHLRSLSQRSPLLAVAVREEGQPAALGVAKVAHAPSAPEILSLYVTPPRWRRGIGARLLASLEQELRTRGCTDVVLRYSTQSPTTPALERMLARRGWSPPQTHLILAQIQLGIVEGSRWAQHRTVAPPFELFPWTALSPEERGMVLAFQEEVPPALRPFSGSIPPEPASSLGLRHGQEIAGWMITHRVAPRMVQFTALYVRERFRTSALSFILVAEALRRVREAYGPEMITSMAVQPDNLSMLRLLERKFAPWVTSRSEMRVSAKSLQP